MTEPLLSVTVPVIRVDGVAYPEVIRDVVRLDIDEDTDGLRTLDLHLLAWGPPSSGTAPVEGLLYLDGRVFDFGRELVVALGPEGAERTVFEGAVSAIEVDWEEAEPPRVRVLAEDALMALRSTRRMHTYEGVSDGDVAAQIASWHGLRAEVDAPGPSYAALQQWNMSDLAFLRERARAAHAELWVEGGALHFTARARRPGTELTLVRGNELTRCTLRADLAHQRTAVRVTGFDVQRRAPIDEEADGTAVAEEVATGLTGPEVLERAFGSRVSYRTRDVPQRDDEARQLARAELLRRARAFVVATGQTSGSPEMMVGSLLTLVGVGGPFEGGGYTVTRLGHRYDADEGFRTDFTAERSTINEVS